jgi:hypothetical protein
MRIFTAAAVLLVCVGLGVWLGLWASVRLGYRQARQMDRRVGALALWMTIICAAAIGFLYAVK